MPQGGAPNEAQMMDEIAKANGIDKENFDYDEWLAKQELDITADPNEKKA